MLEIGIQAPDFELPDQDGVMHKLSDYKGKKVILYFYPKDNTAGCTKQACGFSERYPQFLEKGIQAPDFELPDQDGVMHKLSDYN